MPPLCHRLSAPGRSICLVLALLCLGCDSETSTSKLEPPADDASLNPPKAPDPKAPPTLDGVIRLLNQQQTSEAKTMLNEVLIRQPNNTEAMLLLAQIHAGEMAWNEAIDILSQLVDQDSNNLEARRGLATLYNGIGNRFEANEQLRFLCRRQFLTFPELRSLSVPERTHINFSEKPDLHSEQQIKRSGMLNMARAFFGRSDNAEAAELIESSPQFAANDPATMAYYGQVAFDLQDPARFNRWLSGQQPSWRRYPEYWTAVGQHQMQQRQFGSAVRSFAEAILREPSDPRPHDLIAAGLEALAEHDEAARFRKRGKEIRVLVQTIKRAGNPEHATPELYQLISERLIKHGRPFQAIGWMGLSIGNFGGSQADGARLMQQREGLNKSFRAAQQQQLQLCRLDWAKYPIDHSQDALSSPATIAKSSIDNAVATDAVDPCFVDVTQTSGLNFQYENASPVVESVFMLHQSAGSGVACLDYDCDGMVDLYFTQAACDARIGNSKKPNQLARNVDLKFHDVTENARADNRNFGTGVTSGDWNQDGLPDVLVANIGTNELSINQGDGTFVTLPPDETWQNGTYSTSVVIADISGDAIPDIYEAVYIEDPKMFQPVPHSDGKKPELFPSVIQHTPGPDRCFLGNGDGTYQTVALPTLPEPKNRLGLGLLVSNLDSRPGNEIFVANDLYANRFWVLEEHDTESSAGDHSRQLRLVDRAPLGGLATGTRGQALACMGIAAADFDHDGRLDFHVTNFSDQWSNLFLQKEDLIFNDFVAAAGLADNTLPMTGFGTQAIDFDNNTTPDLVIGNGHIEDTRHLGGSFRMPLQFFTFDGSRFHLATDALKGDSDFSSKTGESTENLKQRLTRAMAKLDWNNDGKIDFVITELLDPSALFENRTPDQNSWLQLRLVGTTSERDAIGARIEIRQDGHSFTNQVTTGDGYLCKNQAIVHFGLGEMETTSVSASIRWPDGTEQKLDNLPINSRTLVVQNEAPFR